MPQDVIRADHFSCDHDIRGDIRHVAFEAGQLPGTCQRGLIEAPRPTGGLDEARDPSRLLALDDVPGPVLLRGERDSIADGSPARVGPHGPP